MAMLAEPRRKQKFSINPRGCSWSNDDSKFGQKLMEKFGWTKGKGLGAKEDGNVEHVKVQVKTDQRGIGCTKNHSDNWIAHQDDFNSILTALNESSSVDVGSAPDSVMSIETKSKNSRGRLHYQKFAKGKDLSSRSSEDLNCIFGVRKTKSEPSIPQCPSEENSGSDTPNETEDISGLKTIRSTDSVQEYFAKKMAAIKKGRSKQSESLLEDSPTGNLVSASMESINEENDKVEFLLGDINIKTKKSKKSKKKKVEEQETKETGSSENMNSENMTVCEDVEMKRDNIEIKKKKRKKNKTENYSNESDEPCVKRKKKNSEMKEEEKIKEREEEGNKDSENKRKNDETDITESEEPSVKRKKKKSKVKEENKLEKNKHQGNKDNDSDSQIDISKTKKKEKNVKTNSDVIDNTGVQETKINSNVGQSKEQLGRVKSLEKSNVSDKRIGPKQRVTMGILNGFDKKGANLHEVKGYFYDEKRSLKAIRKQERRQKMQQFQETGNFQKSGKKFLKKKRKL